MVLLVLWLLGLVTSTTLGGLIYVLVVVSVVLFLFRFIGGARAGRQPGGAERRYPHS